MPLGNLPESGKKLWERVYDEALKGSCNGEKSCAAAVAWKAMKNAGWKKDENGNWHKASLTEFSFRIEKAVFDKASNKMRWRAVASDTDSDSYDDSMSQELFADFLQRITSKEAPPAQFKSKFWDGGMPYVSLSHYQDLDGKAVPGEVERIYVDGNRLKAVGTFYDNELGRACFKAICTDLYQKAATQQPPVRISIAFLDYAHKHKSTGYLFERTNVDDFCIECAKNLANGIKGGKIFLKGLLVHLAMTRVPVNKRTSMEVDKSMTTRLEDALSIVGDEAIVSEIEELSILAGKSEALVVKNEAKATYSVDNLPNDPQNTIADEKEEPEEDEEEKEDDDMEEVKSEIAALKSMITEIKGILSTPAHPLDTVLAAFKSEYSAIMSEPISKNEKLQKLQEPYAIIGRSLIDMAEASSPVEAAAPTQPESNLVQAFSEALAPLAQKLDLLIVSQQNRPTVQPEVITAAPVVPQRRSISPLVAQSLATTAPVKKSETPKLRSLIERTT